MHASFLIPGINILLLCKLLQAFQIAMCRFMIYRCLAAIIKCEVITRVFCEMKFLLMDRLNIACLFGKCLELPDGWGQVVLLLITRALHLIIFIYPMEVDLESGWILKII